MEISFIPTKIKINELKNFDELLKILPKKFGVVCLIQYLEITKNIINDLKNKGYFVLYKEPLFVIGCNAENANLPVDTILLIGNGKFHALEIVREFEKEVILYDPITGEIKKISKDEYKKYITNVYLLLEELKTANNVGILISIKPGQYNYKILKSTIEKLKDKRIYLFITDKIDFNQFLNFQYIDFWIIVACPRIIDDIVERKLKAITIDILRKEMKTQ